MSLKILAAVIDGLTPKLKMFDISTINEEGMEQIEDHKIQARLHSQAHTYLSSIANSIVS